jgi:hypothetical protein
MWKIKAKRLVKWGWVVAVAVGVGLLSWWLWRVNNTDYLSFKTNFYYVYYRTAGEEGAASSISVAVQNYGGAGYIVGFNGSYYITVACYYTDADASKVCDSLNAKSLNCQVLKTDVDGYKLTTKVARQNKQLYYNNLSTLLTLSKLCYQTANSVDGGEMTQQATLATIIDVKKTLQGLLRQNADNTFTTELNYLIAEADDVAYGYIYSRDVRRLQIAITDTILNINLA